MDDPMVMLMLAAPVLSCFLSSSAGLVLWKMGKLCEWFPNQTWACNYGQTDTPQTPQVDPTPVTDPTPPGSGNDPGGGGGGGDPGNIPPGNGEDPPKTDPTKPGSKPKPDPTKPGSKPKPNPTKPGNGGNVGSEKNIELGWWAWQNNSPCNSVTTATNAQLYAFKSVSVPKSSGWRVNDILYIKGLVGKTMPKSGAKHNGYVRVADYSDEATGWSTTNTNVPIVRIYLGDFKALTSGTWPKYAACTRQSATKAGRNPPLTLGYAGSSTTSWKLPLSTTAQKKTAGNFNVAYGGNELGSGTCGVCYSGTDWNKTALGNCWFGGSTNTADCPKKK